MKSTIKTILILSFLSSILISQNARDIGAGVIDFLLRNPKTANKLDKNQSIALDIIGDLLSTESERQHKLEYASSGSNHISINTTTGQQAQFVKNENGKVFLLLDGVIYPIAAELVNQAKGFEQVPLNISSSSRRTNVVDRFEKAYTIYTGDSKKFLIDAIIPYKWDRDFGEDGFDFDDLKQIKVQFYDNENFMLAVPYYLPYKIDNKLLIEIIDSYDGKTVYDSQRKLRYFATEATQFGITISAGILPVGNYIIYAKIINDYNKEVQAYNSENIQIIEGNSATYEISFYEESYRETKISPTTPEGLFLYTDYSDINSNDKYDRFEFDNINLTDYSFLKNLDSGNYIYVGINFPHKSGELILTVKKDGKFLMNIFRDYQYIYSTFFFHSSPNFNSNKIIGIQEPGKYNITVSFVEGGTFEKELLITD